MDIEGLEGLTEEEIQELSEFLDPDVSYVFKWRIVFLQPSCPHSNLKHRVFKKKNCIAKFKKNEMGYIVYNF